MSLYGDIKKVGSSTFQFDRVYTSRKELETKVASGDGVYAGRYVLVEYGEHYINASQRTDEEVVNQTTNILALDNLENKLVTLADESNLSEVIESNGELRYDRVYELKSYYDSLIADLTHFGASYDSTVWQKVYTKDGDKYIMVAELNATVPKINLVKDKPIKYTPTNNNEEKSDVTAAHINNGSLTDVAKISNVKEEYNKPYFDTVISNELGYTLHIPANLELKADSDQIDFNEKGFNIVYSYGDKEGVSDIAWIPNPEEFDYTATGQIDGNGNQIGTVNSVQEINSKTLFMSFPALGNMMNSLYNLLYGEPAKNADLTHGAIRPYFANFYPSTRRMPIMALDSNTNEMVQVTADGEGRYVKAEIGTTVNAQAQDGDNKKTINPSNVVVVRHIFANDEDTYVIIPSDDDTIYQDLLFAYNNPDGITEDDIIKVTVTQPNGDTDDLSWVKDVPAITDLLENNTAGLATVLQSLFGYKNPFTGTTRYYLYADWQNKEGREYSDPAILHKPEVIGGYTTNLSSVQNLYKLPESSNPEIITETQTSVDYLNGWSDGDYYIDFNSWTMNEYMGQKQYDLNVFSNISISSQWTGEQSWGEGPIKEEKIYEPNWSGVLSFYRYTTAPTSNEVDQETEQQIEENTIVNQLTDIIKITFTLNNKGLYGGNEPLDSYKLSSPIFSDGKERDLTEPLYIEFELDSELINELQNSVSYTVPFQLKGYKNGKQVYATKDKNIELNTLFVPLVVAQQSNG